MTLAVASCYYLVCSETYWTTYCTGYYVAFNMSKGRFDDLLKKAT